MSRVAPWLIAALALAAAGIVVVSALRRETAADAERNREIEARELLAQNQIVAAQKDHDGMQDDLDAAIKKNTQLKEALEAATRAAPTARVVRIVQASTGPVPMNEEAIRAMCAGLLPSQDDHKPESELKGEIHVASVDLHTDRGNLIATGAAEALQVWPEPKRVLFSGRFIAPATTASELVPPPHEQQWPWFYHEAIGIGAGLVAGLLLRR